jgi:iron(III) transport system substrate-binding protein
MTLTSALQNCRARPPAIGIIVVALLLVAGCSSPKQRVVLYCAQDQEFAEGLLRDFTERSGLHVDVKYDTEADKSVSLYTELLREKDRPRCDVHWNNEIIGTIRLWKRGVLESYDSPSSRPYPHHQSTNHAWTAFAARARVLIVNTQLVTKADRPRSIFDMVAPRWKGRIAMAKPQFGTTATQAACLFEVLGAEGAKDFYRALRDNSVAIVPGNKQVAESVGHGQFAFGMTDTDDAIAEVQAGRPVALVFPDRDGSSDSPRIGTLFLPNTVAVIRGCPNLDGAKKLVDYLLSAEVEKRLAESESHQIPLNPEVKAVLPKEIERPRESGGTVKSMQVDFGRAADLWEEVQTFLRNEFAR